MSCISNLYPTTTTTSSTLMSTLISSSQKPLYLLSFSHQLYTSRATNLSVTILTESTVDVLARLTQGKAYLSSASVTIPGGWLFYVAFRFVILGMVVYCDGEFWFVCVL